MSDIDWKECLDWIKRLEFLEADEPLLRYNLKIHDFAQFLRDGVVLCRLLNALAPGVVDHREFSQRPQMSEFLCKKNITLFLAKCQKEFKMIPEDLFEVPDLLELANFAKVIHTLSFLSNTRVALKCGVKGFNIASNQDYGTLKSVADKMLSTEEDERAYTKYDDRIYQDILSIKRQESMRESVTVSKMTKREYCLKEIVDTERNYMAMLQMIVEKFKRPLTGKLHRQNVDVLFRGIEDLQLIHSGFFSDLSKAAQSRHGSIHSPGHMTMSDCFIKWKESFLKYADYCSNLVSVNTLLIKLLQHPISKAAIDECQKSANDGKFRLSDLLTVPMQRVLRYHLLLKELIKNTDEKHPEWKSLNRAHEEMVDLAAYVNEAKRDNESMTIVESVQNSIINLPPGTDFKSFGRLQMDGELKYKVGEERKDKPGFVFLFDKTMLICKSKGTEQYTLKECYELMDSVVTAISNSKEKFGFHLYMLKSNKMSKNNLSHKSSDILVFFAKSEALRTKWMESFRRAIDNICPPGWTNHRNRFILTTFNEPTICDVCRKLLRGVFFQGYKCKKTGMCVHKSCINQAKDSNGPPIIPPKETSGHKVRAISNFNGYAPPSSLGGALNFNEGDVIVVVCTENDPWWLGRVGSCEGYFSKNCVKLIRSDETPNLLQPNNPLSHLTPHPTTPMVPMIPSRQSRSSSLVHTDNPLLLPPNPLSHTLSLNSDAPPIPVRERLSHPSSSPSPVVPPPFHPPKPSSSSLLSDFFGEDLAVFPWFVGEMTRERAGELLKELHDGTYLVRISNNADRRGELSLSLKYGEGRTAVKHMKIQRGSDKRWFLADCQTFLTVQDTIEFYQENSLSSCFTEVPTTLDTAFKDTLPKPV